MGQGAPNGWRCVRKRITFALENAPPGAGSHGARSLHVAGLKEIDTPWSLMLTEGAAAMDFSLP